MRQGNGLENLILRAPASGVRLLSFARLEGLAIAVEPILRCVVPDPEGSGVMAMRADAIGAPASPGESRRFELE